MQHHTCTNSMAKARRATRPSRGRGTCFFWVRVFRVLVCFCWSGWIRWKGEQAWQPPTNKWGYNGMACTVTRALTHTHNDVYPRARHQILPYPLQVGGLHLMLLMLLLGVICVQVCTSIPSPPKGQSRCGTSLLHSSGVGGLLLL